MCIEVSVQHSLAAKSMRDLQEAEWHCRHDPAKRYGEVRPACWRACEP